MSYGRESGCECSGAWFEQPCSACQYRSAKQTVQAYESRPAPAETELDRLRRENAELRGKIERLEEKTRSSAAMEEYLKNRIRK